MPFTWTVPPTSVFPQGYQAYVQQLEAVGQQIGAARSGDITDWMKSNHPWTNRTGDAEAGLHTTASQNMPVLLELTLSHGDNVPYGIWLEIANGGRFAVVAPAVDHWGPRIIEDFKAALGI